MATEVTEKTKVNLTMASFISVIVTVLGLPVFMFGVLDSRYAKADAQAVLAKAVEGKADRADVVTRVEFIEIKQQGAYTAAQVKEIRQDVKQLLHEQRRALRRSNP